MKEKFSSPRFKDPVELVDIRDLSSFRCNLGWQKYDRFDVHAPFLLKCAKVIDDENLKPTFSINETDIEATHTNLAEFLEKGLVRLIYGNYHFLDIVQKYCPFCSSIMSSANFLEKGECTSPVGFGIGDDMASFMWLEYCFNCHYWRLQHAYFYQGIQRVCHLVYESLLSKTREFSDHLPEGFVFEVAQWVKKNPEMWHTMSAVSFEKLVAAIFRANYQDAEIFHVGQPDDGGKDVIFIDSGNRQWLI